MINYTTEKELINSFLKYFNTKINDISKFSKYLIYSIDDKNIGFVDFSFIYDRIELNYIYVEKSYRNKNIASKLMDKLIEFAIDNKCINITLEVDESNDAAINLYKKYGFTIATIRKKYYGKNDGYLMIREMV
ncbi:MAG: GNAT family N-acetyltransferase [Tenericutes bacterium]|nr:GNAT family N-acetyltransferase [Mycoplasmatota bacterium]